MIDFIKIDCVAQVFWVTGRRDFDLKALQAEF